EFEIIAQIKLLQSACKNYAIEKDPEFLAWFYWLQSLSETESYQLSCEIEPLTEISSNPAKFQPTLIVTAWEEAPSARGDPTLFGDAQSPTQDPALDHLLSPFSNLLSKVTKVTTNGGSCH
uniref:Uncharacterized protein n=1 Tax=Callorhinchus milii TaxID=7868 RepID=A0A4W3HCM7_CALMI